MAVRDIVVWPDPRLKIRCEPVDVTNGVVPAHAQTVARDLLDTMDVFPGCVGVAAPQIGELIRMVAIDVTGNKRARSCHGRIVLVNPCVVASSGNVEMREGCLSIPDFTGNVTRPATVRIDALSASGDPLTLSCDAWEARVVQHEIDHLDGLLFLDRVARAADVFPRKVYR